MGGNTIANFATPAATGGFFHTNSVKNLQKCARSPEKTSHYNVDGTGRDSYILCNHGGFANNYRYIDDHKAYIKNLRNYEQHTITNKDLGGIRKGSPNKDYFI